MRHANMKNVSSNVDENAMPITRSRAKALASSGGLPPVNPSTNQDGKPLTRAKSKRGASDENKQTTGATSGQPKKRAALKDVSNVVCESASLNCMWETRMQSKKHPAKRTAKVTPAILVNKRPHLQVNTKQNIIEEHNEVKAEALQELQSPTNFTQSTLTQQSECDAIKQCGIPDLMPMHKSTSMTVTQQSTSTGDEHKLCKKEGLDSLGISLISDIDSKHRDPQMCSLYAPDIYTNLHAMELDRRLSSCFMERIQRDITKGMRGILIDWLVEVSEEYRLVPDTLYLTVNLIDRFLSENYIEKQKLQLLGVTCMLIACKYEEICAPRAEEFCLITDNTYTKEQVVKMESCVLNLLGFRLSIPTTKKFLRRFIQAAQASYEVPSVELEFMANYLAELTLIDYSFLKFLPSLIAASAVFLAQWTLDQSKHPWNPTLEHYTRYKASELKTTVSALQDLQLNANQCSLKAICEKYKQPKFKCVATLTSPNLLQSLFSESKVLSF
ncbi:cyclin-A2-1-like [Ipomoea triloba]|uniref:cyclin-A2-1-like n=1 Tax=Ipomoea triloba TaxID=35885 RepID=UPI00125E4CBD|nr:cyclin-A2-1-like [Ipomoea triloba]